MKTSHRRIALLTGASLSALGVTALGIASPAMAAPHDVAGPGVNPGTSTTASPIDICTIAAATPACFYGVYDTADGAAAATVNSTATGRIIQADTGPTIDLTLTNAAGQSAEVGAIASATGAGAQAAVANITPVAIQQRAVATTGDATVTLDNDGTLLVDALAIASATAGAADASANLNAALWQTAIVTAAATGVASANVVNDGTLSALASAIAIGTGFASADASVGSGVFQGAYNQGSGDASVDFTNNGAVNIQANAFASGSAADASASLSSGIYQSVTVSGSGDASITLTNSSTGTIDISANATAVAAVGNASADASLSSGIYQTAQNFGTGDATASVVNDGTINIAANASASAAVSADASASLDNPAIYQFASAVDGNASVDVTNNGTLNIEANATAVAGVNADATATIETGISQTASATGAGHLASATVNNAGTLNIAAVANAVGGTFASADASVDDVISQSAYGFAGADAAVEINNASTGTINILANAVASASDAVASATVESGIYQWASGNAGGDASASITNAGTLNLAATATANGATDAYAFASIDTGISQSASATGGGNAAVTLANATGAALNISAIANANATTGSISATASMNMGIQQSAFATGVGTASNSITNDGTIAITASANVAGGSYGDANARIDTAIEQFASATGGDASNTLTNTGTLTISALAHATSTRNSASATASITGAGIYQDASATGGDATNTLINNGTITILAHAVANAETRAYAFASVDSAISQYANAVSGNATNVIVNTPDISVNAIATATGNSATATATNSSAIYQDASAFVTGDATVSISNGTADTLTIGATANATGIVNDASAFAYVTGAVYQFAFADSGVASASLDNAGALDISANASANGVTHAFASADVFSGIYQSATAATGTASVSVNNSGALTIAANANANATAGGATASATIAGPTSGAISQFASGTAGSLASIDNSGSINITAAANASGTASANALASAHGVFQSVVGGTESFVNSGSFVVDATANAVAASGTALATALAVGVVQNSASSAVFANGGTYTVHAGAHATGTTGTASAVAVGYAALNPALLTVTNSGTMNVTASATATNSAFANAVGIAASVTGATPLVATQQALLTGTLTNSGTLHVVAQANGGGTFTTPTGGGGVTTVALSSANATGILLTSGVNTMTVTNTGSILVDAISNGSPVSAIGVNVVGNGLGLPPTADDVFTFTNDGGTIQVRESIDGGENWTRGMAIDVSAAPNNSVINLLGTTQTGTIYGNIQLQTGDVVNVESGTTYFNGILNPATMPAGGVTDATLDSGLSGVGQLNITNDGNLILADPRITDTQNMYDGPAYVFVDDLNIDANGTISYELQPAAGGTQPVGTYPQIFTNTADITDGHLVALLTTPNGLFANEYFWDNVIDANDLTGEFASCTIGGAYAGSLLLTTNDICEYEDANVDIRISRVPFNAVAGLNRNGTAVGTGLECIYDTSLTGGVVGLLGDLFLITDPVNYNAALNMLSGSVYANYLQSFPSLGVHYNDLVDHATNCEIPALAGSVLECRASAPLHVWGQADYQWRKADGDIEAGNTKSKRLTGMLGIDASVGNAAIVGASVGYGNNHVRDSQFGDSANGNGFNVGLYGVYDPGAFFVKAMTTYSWFNNTSSTRNIDFTGLGNGTTFAGRTNGDPDVHMWTAGLHGGARFPMGGGSVITPYLNLDYVNAKLQGFTETGLDGANLTVFGGKASHTFLTGGVKWATQMGRLVPEINLGYRNRFGDERSDFRAAFLGDEDCDFDIVSAAQKRGTFLAGLSIGGKVGMADLRIGYEGEFNGDVTSHSGNFKVVIPLGGHAAPPPPPPPAPVAAPPPPPPPAPTPPPPPPPPVERGERGQ